MPKKLNVVGLGNALMDVLVRIPTNDIIEQNDLTVGVMHPVDDQRWQEVYATLGDLSKEETRLLAKKYKIEFVRREEKYCDEKAEQKYLANFGGGLCQDWRPNHHLVSNDNSDPL